MEEDENDINDDNYHTKVICKVIPIRKNKQNSLEEDDNNENYKNNFKNEFGKQRITFQKSEKNRGERF